MNNELNLEIAITIHIPSFIDREHFTEAIRNAAFVSDNITPEEYAALSVILENIRKAN